MKYTLTRIMLPLLFLLMPFSAIAENFPKDENPSITFDSFHNALGIYGTSAAGKPVGGLHYQHWFNRFGFQITGGGVYDPQATFGNRLDYSATIDGLWTVYGNSFSNFLSGRLYVWTSAGHHGYIPLDDTTDENSVSGKVKEGPFHANALAGIGIGIETILFEHFSFPIQFGYTGEFPQDPSLGFSVGGGLRYRY